MMNKMIKGLSGWQGVHLLNNKDLWSEFKCDLFQVHMIDRNDSNEFQHWQGNELANEDHDDHGQEAPTLEELGEQMLKIQLMSILDGITLMMGHSQ
jgi:hypothetical protein